MTRTEGSGIVSHIEELAEARDAQGLVNALRSEDESLRKEAAIKLGKIGQSAVGQLIEAANDGDWRVRFGAVWALGFAADSGDRVALGKLIDCMTDADARIRERAIVSLPILSEKMVIRGILHGEELLEVLRLVVGPLVHALADQETAVRRRAVQYLDCLPLKDDPRYGQCQSLVRSEAAEALLELLFDSDDDLRGGAAWALRHLAFLPATGPLVGLLNDPVETVRFAAQRALTAIGRPAVPSLVEALSDNHAYVRELAAMALGEIGDTQAKGPLRHLLEWDSNPWVRERTHKALEQIDVRQA